MAVTQDRFRTVAELARELRVSPRTIYRALERGDLPGVRVGRQLRIPSAAIETLTSDSLDRFRKDTTP